MQLEDTISSKFQTRQGAMKETVYSETKLGSLKGRKDTYKQNKK